MDDDAALCYVSALQTPEERCAATSISRSDLLAAVRALSGCQRCGFVEQVLAALSPGMAGPPAVLIPSGDSDRTTRNGAGQLPPNSLHNDDVPLRAMHSSVTVAGELTGGRCTGPTAAAEAAPGAPSPTGALLSPAQLLALVSRSCGPTDLVGLLQFAWKDRDGAGGSGSVDGAGGHLALSDTLLSKPRLLQRFLQESVATMQALVEEVGDCRRHVGYPGPSELASTLARLETQRCHTLERLAAWGVLRVPPAKSQPSEPHGGGGGGVLQGDEGMGGNAGHLGHRTSVPVRDGEEASDSEAQVRQDRPPRQQQRSADGSGRLGVGVGLGNSFQAVDPHRPAEALAHPRYDTRGSGGPGVQLDGAPDEEDAELALAIRLSLQDTAGPCPAGGALMEQVQSQPQPQSRGTPAAPPAPMLSRRPQRTPPRPTGGAVSVEGGGASGGGRGLESCSAARGLDTWPGRSAGHSPANGGPAEAAARRTRAPVDSPGATMQGRAALGLVDDCPPAQSPSAPAQLPPLPGTPGAASARPGADAPLAAVAQSPLATTTPSRRPSPSTAAPPAQPASSPYAAEGPAPGPAPEPSPTRAAKGGAGAGARLPVAAAVSAAAGLDDATVLVDSAAVAALPQGLRERVEHLVTQLTQVQQRRGRLEHACQHGVLAGGRKLLLILLQLMWATLRRAAARAPALGSRPTSPVPPKRDVTAPRAAEQCAQEPHYHHRLLAQPLPPSQPSQPTPPPTQTGAAAATTASQAGREPRRRARYEGLLADLAAGLGEDDMYLDILGPELELAGMRWGRTAGGGGAEPLGAGAAARCEDGAVATPQQRQPVAAAGARASGISVIEGEEEEDNGTGAEDGEWLQEVAPSPTSRLGRAQSSPLQLLSAESPAARRRGVAGLRGWERNGEREEDLEAEGHVRDGPEGNDDDDDEENSGDGWDAARSSCPRLQPPALRRSHHQSGHALAPSLRHRSGSMSVALSSRSSGAPQSTGLAGPDPASSLRFSAVGAWAGLAGYGPGGNGWGAQRSSWAQLERDVRTECGAGCLAVRAEQAEQLRMLQGQLERCQSSQSELQGEVGRLLDMMAESRRVQEQATSSVRRELAQWQGEPTALQGLSADELAELAGRMEAALSRVRAAQLQAAADRDLMCPVCWERRKGLVFGCGHQTCCECGEKLNLCPICRELISLRIRVYS